MTRAKKKCVPEGKLAKQAIETGPTLLLSSDDSGACGAALVEKSTFSSGVDMKDEGLGLLGPGQACVEQQALCLFPAKLVIDSMPSNEQAGPSTPFSFVSHTSSLVTYSSTPAGRPGDFSPRSPPVLESQGF